MVTTAYRVGFLRNVLTVGVGAALIACSPNQSIAPGEDLKLGRSEFVVQAPDRSGSVTVLNRDTIRFELHPGEQWAWDRKNGSKAERAELTSRDTVRFGQETSAEFSLRIVELDLSPGRRHTLLLQLHGPNRGELGPDTVFKQPPFDIHVRDRSLEFWARSGREGKGRNPNVFLGKIPIELNEWIDFRVEILIGDAATGQLDIWVDGDPFIRYSGPIGYDAGRGTHYWKFGAYQYGARTQRSVIEFRCLSFDREGFDIRHDNRTDADQEERPTDCHTRR